MRCPTRKPDDLKSGANPPVGIGKLRRIDLGSAQQKLGTVGDPETKARLEGLVRDLKASVAKGDKPRQAALETELADLLFVLE